jgi:MFS transporter, PHS family, inorganic phosphate transporter
MPEGKKYLESQELSSRSSGSSTKAKDAASTKSGNPSKMEESTNLPTIPAPTHIHETPDGLPLEAISITVEPLTRKEKLRVFFIYFSEWRHLKMLLGTTLTWFLVDVAFYGTNLNQSVILTAIGFSTGKNEYHVLMRNALGNLIIAVAGYVPGYLFTIYFIEKIGRRWIQIQGFLIAALMFGIIAGDYTHLKTAGKFVCFAIAQFFFNFGPNATTFIIPAEIFPSRVRGFAHGVSAAVGKLGAILSALLFNYLSGPAIIGLSNVLWIFFTCNILGAILTFFLIPETKGRDADLVDYEEWLDAARMREKQTGVADNGSYEASK